MTTLLLVATIIASFQLLASANPILDRQPTNQHIRQILLQLETNGTSVINHTVVAEPDLLANNISTLYVQALVQRLRQDEGETGLEVGQNVGQIISGVLGGGLENIFTGSSSFIGNSAAQEEVNFVLHNIAPVFDTILKYGYDGLKQYFGFGATTLQPMIASTQQPQLVYQPQPNQTLGIQTQSLNKPIQQQQLQAQRPASVFLPVQTPIMTNPINVDNDNENDGDTEVDVSKKQFKSL